MSWNLSSFNGSFILYFLFLKLKTRVKNNIWSGYDSNSVSEADVEVSENAMALKRCRVMEMR